ncbi:serine-rich adhesin for platelets isoform X2 [Parasteatoda tepidariorum]|nr:uncharacterized protein LOC107441411 isoform X2 [Parasteatoda tepidariorum]
MPSSVVPIDVSGQSFSRMASFRRSLIHVDFFIRRKRKDKRRNTVAEGDTKELKNALQNIINEEHNIVPNDTFSKKLTSNSIFKPAVRNDIKKVTIQETNNNFPKDITFSKDNTEKRNCCPEQDKVLKNGSMKYEIKNNHHSDSVINKRKPKSNLPISTISAAMNVAVEMRQLSGIEDSSSNQSYSSDQNSSDCDKEKEHSTITGEDSGFSDNFKNRSKNNCKVSNPKVTIGNKDTEGFSSASSNATSLESDDFLMSSDEDSSELMVQKYGSSTSLSTLSDGSLNSLLSQTGTEMHSSTGTLTSIGQERFPTPPPPPFVIVVPKKELISNTTPIFSTTNVNSKNLSSKPSPNHETSSRISKKVISPKKSSKSDKLQQRKSSIESNKSIFTSLVNKKSQTKGMSLHSKSTMTPPCFDMYGSNSPQKISWSSKFVKENLQPLAGTEPKSYLQSFLPSNNPKPGTHIGNKNKVIDNVHREITEISTANISNTNLDNFSQKNDTEIPLKYAHHVVVTPISRQDEDNKNLSKKSLLANYDKGPEQENETILKSHYFSQPRSRNIENVTHSSQKLQRPKTLQTGQKTAARVVLDPEGKVIYSTNSLDRRFSYKYPNEHPTRNRNEKCIPSQSSINMSKNTKCNFKPHTCYPPKNSFIQKMTNDNLSYCDKNISKVNNISTFSNIHLSNDNSGLPGIPLQISSAGQQIYFHSETESPIFTNESKIKSFNSSESSTLSKTTPPSYEEAVGRHCPHIVIADPNISGLPKIKTMLTEENINLHLENIERLNKMHLESIADSYKSLISPQTNSSNPLDNNLSKLQKSTMSTEDLFAVIHDCKKRMNIKTDSDISLGSSSRSTSPSIFKPNQTKGILAETGYLSPRNSSNFNDCRNRRSWADFRPSSSSPNERKSLASDRLGRTKPTSMHDFKMLLLEARSSTQTSGPRKSAVEMLKVFPFPKSPDSEVSPLSSSPHYTQSFSVQSSPTSPSYIHNGHSTVPLKRHNNRACSSLQSRYTLYPPIFEDCSEEAEIKSENATKSLN